MRDLEGQYTSGYLKYTILLIPQTARHSLSQDSISLLYRFKSNQPVMSEIYHSHRTIDGGRRRSG